MRYWFCFLCFTVILIIHIKHLLTLFLHFYIQSTLNCMTSCHGATPTVNSRCTNPTGVHRSWLRGGTSLSVHDNFGTYTFGTCFFGTTGFGTLNVNIGTVTFGTYEISVQSTSVHKMSISVQASSVQNDVQMLLRPALLPRDISRANDWSLPNCPV